MKASMLFPLLPFMIPLIFISIQFIGYVSAGRKVLWSFLFGISEIIAMFIYPLMFFAFLNEGSGKECCGNTPYIAYEHQVVIKLLLFANMFSYFYSRFRDSTQGPLAELLISVFMIAGIAINVVFLFHLQDISLWVVGNLPMILLLLLQLAVNHHRYLDELEISPDSGNLTLFLYKVMTSNWFVKFPLLVVLSIPVLVLISVLLMLLGQKPDTMIRAFTDTYKHGLSQLECPDVPCPDQHFLCTIAAEGHKEFVKPQRYGVRHGCLIEVNRQLLIANAFEELLEQRTPSLHRVIRRAYNKIGSNCRRLYDVLGNKWISDAVFVLMKPLEWLFLLALYLFDKKPENRIAVQYLSLEDRKKLAHLNSTQ